MNSNRVALMAADPELGGELLAVGCAISAILDHHVADRLSLKQIHLLAYGPKGPRLRSDSDARQRLPTRNGTVDWKSSRTAELLRLDARCYRPPEARTIVCGAPMPRKPQCGKKAQLSGLYCDWVTGEQYYLGACGKREHQVWFAEQDAANRVATPEVGEVLPYANSGGVLARHFAEIDWPALWRSLDPTWREHPEREPADPAAPKLQLLVNDQTDTKVAIATADDTGKRRPDGRPSAQRRNRGLYAIPNLNGPNSDA